MKQQPTTQVFGVLAGDPGALNAAKRLLPRTARTGEYQTLETLFQAIKKKKLSGGIVCLERNDTGTQHQAFRGLQKNNLALTAEIYLTDTPASYARYGVIQNRPKEKEQGHGNKVSLVVSLPHVPGSLARFLVQCSGRGLNLTKVESWPIPEKPGSFEFFVDFEHNYEPAVLGRILAALEEEATDFLLLGSYQSGKISS